MMVKEEKIKKVRSVIGFETPESDILQALSHSGDDPDAAIKFLAENPCPVSVSRTITSTGVRISTQIKEEVKEELVVTKVAVTPGMSFDDFLKATNTKVMTTEEYIKSHAKELLKEPEVGESCSGLEPKIVLVKEEPDVGFEKEGKIVRVKEEPDVGFEKEVTQSDVKGSNDQVKSGNDESLKAQVKKEAGKEVVKTRDSDFESFEDEFDRWCEENERSKKESRVKGVGTNNGVISGDGLSGQVKEEEPIKAELIMAIVPVKEEIVIDAEPINWSKAIVPVKEEPRKEAIRENFMKKFNRIPVGGGQSSQKTFDAKKRITEDQKPCSIPIENGNFPEEPDWFLVGRTMVTAVSTTKGRKLADNEIVHFSFPTRDWRSNAHWIVRFSTKRHGEVFSYLGYISFMLKFYF